MLQAGDFDAVVLDLSLPGMNGLDLLSKIKSDPRLSNLPVVIYTGKNLSRQEEAKIKRNAASIITKDIGSADKLLDETALFLHRVVARLPDSKRRVIEARAEDKDATRAPSRRAAPVAPAPRVEAVSTPANANANAGANVSLSGRTILVVDDDVRNIFAITSVLEAHDVNVLFAENGRDAIETLAAHPEVEVVLMDIMMPEMDGYETTQRIRAGSEPAWRTLPVIALTAKAMAGDREKCLAAGATDYITKPVDVDRLMEMVRGYLA